MTVFDPAPTMLEQVLDPAWVEGMLAARWPDACVRGVDVVETLATQATKVRFTIDVEDAPAFLPTALCAKGVLTRTGAPSQASVVETLFYARLAERAGVRVPPCIHAGLNGAGDNGVIVMHDMVAAGATFLSALAPFAPDEAAATLDQLAILHAAGWEGGALYEAPFVPRFLDMIGARPILPQDRLQQLLDGERGAALPVVLKDAGRLQRAVAALAGQVRRRPSCLVHGDAHAGNVYRASDGIGLVDWQILQRGEWAQDVAYHVAAALSPEDRRTHERALLAHYLDRLRALGGPRLDPDEAWTRYRAAMIYGFYLWGITQKVEPAITNEFVRRLGQAIDDLGSYAIVGL